MKQKKPKGVLKEYIKTTLAAIWQKIKDHPFMTIGGGMIGGSWLFSGCMNTTNPPAIVEPSGEIESGLPSGIIPGIIDSGN